MDEIQIAALVGIALAVGWLFGSATGYYTAQQDRNAERERARG